MCQFLNKIVCGCFWLELNPSPLGLGLGLNPSLLGLGLGLGLKCS